MTSKMIRRIAIGAAAVLVLAGVAFGPQVFSHFSKKTTGPSLATVSFKSFPVVSTASGTLLRGSTLYVNFGIAGVVQQVFVNVGDQVSIGQLLAKLDDTNQVAALAAAQASYASAQSALSAASGGDPAKLSLLQQAVTQAQNNLTNTQNFWQGRISSDLANLQQHGCTGYAANGVQQGANNSANSPALTANTSLSAVPNGQQVSGQTVTFTATVDQSAATGTVTFIDGSTSIGSGTLSTGTPNTATFSTTTLSVGSHSITANYAGDGTYSGSTSPAVSYQITSPTPGPTPTPTPAPTPSPTTTTVTSSSPNPSQSGQTVMFTAAVNQSAATGTVTFFDGGAQIGTPAPLSAGSASLQYSGLSIGNHSITAAYNGDANYSPSPMSAPLSQSVTDASCSSLISTYHSDQAAQAQQVGTAQAAYNNAVAALGRGAGSNPAGAAAAQAQAAAAQANLQRATADEAKTLLTAPEAGAILAINGQAGQNVSAGSTVNPALPGSSTALNPGPGPTNSFLVIGNGTDFQVSAAFSQGASTQLKIGQTGTMNFDAIPGLSMPCHVVALATTAAQLNGVPVFYAAITPDGTDQRLRSGMTSNVSINVAQATNVLAAPNQAISTSGGVPHVDVWYRNTAVPTQVSIGLIGDQFTEITSGLAEGQQVVLSAHSAVPTPSGTTYAP